MNGMLMGPMPTRLPRPRLATASCASAFPNFLFLMSAGRHTLCILRVVEFCCEYFEFWPRIDVDNFNGFLLLVTGAKSRFPLLETTEPENGTSCAFSNFLFLIVTSSWVPLSRGITSMGGTLLRQQAVRQWQTGAGGCRPQEPQIEGSSGQTQE